MRAITYKGSIYVNPNAAGLESLGLTPADAAGVMIQLAREDVLQRRDELLQVAAVRIAPLQDAQDLATATAAESAQLLAWKQYRVDLSRIEQQSGFPTVLEWPEVPAQ